MDTKTEIKTTIEFNTIKEGENFKVQDKSVTWDTRYEPMGVDDEIKKAYLPDGEYKITVTIERTNN